MRRTKHNLSHHRLTSFSMGELVPIGCVELLMGDTIAHATRALLRSSPLNAPVMHPVDVKVHHWKVPLRLIWEDFEDFITGGPDGNNASVFPTIDFSSTGIAVGSLANHLGLPVMAAGSIPTVSALPFRAFNLIYNHFYRDQDLQSERVIDITSGPDTTTDVTLPNACWEKDYYTSARLTPQKGDDVLMPLGDEAPVLGIGKANATFGNSDVTLRESDGVSRTYADASIIDHTNINSQFFVEESLDDPGYPRIRADLRNATGASVNEARFAFAMQRYKENMSRFGSRFNEYLERLGVKPSDARLQLPEYLGGGKSTIQFSEVLQSATQSTSGTSGATGVGEMRGHGISAQVTRGYRNFNEEPALLISLCVVRPKTIYMDGIRKMWNRRTKEEFWQPELEHIGQQQILNKEVRGAHASPDGVFGYQDRYDEYRRQESFVTGDFATTLNYWHMARSFSSDPALNDTFVRANPTKRINQSTTTPNIYMLAHHRLIARRLVCKFGTSYIF